MHWNLGKKMGLCERCVWDCMNAYLMVDRKHNDEIVELKGRVCFQYEWKDVLNSVGSKWNERQKCISLCFHLHRNGQTSFMFINRQGNPSNHETQVTVLHSQFKMCQLCMLIASCHTTTKCCNKYCVTSNQSTNKLFLLNGIS